MTPSTQIYCGDNVTVLREHVADESIDLTVTSPPYDNLRTYKGFTWDFEALAKELYRVTKPGGVVVWVIADATIKGSETGTSFKQALYFKEIGFNLHDTMIFSKRAVGACGSTNSYQQAFEYMFVFTKGKIETFNPILDLVAQKAGKQIVYAKTKSDSTGYPAEKKIKIAPLSSKRQNVWTYRVGRTSGNDKVKHPAVFPEALAHDHILSWSNEGDTVLDPFLGSGTTGKMALLTGRNFIGMEISPEYVEIAQKRIESARNTLQCAA